MTEEIIIDGVDISECEFANACDKKIKCVILQDDVCEINPYCEGYNCYYKQLKRLEQENKELKNIIKIHDSTKYDYYKLMKENEELKEEVKELDKMTGIFSARLCNKYRSALEEIKEMNKLFFERKYGYPEDLIKIDNIINEVLK